MERGEGLKERRTDGCRESRSKTTALCVPDSCPTLRFFSVLHLTAAATDYGNSTIKKEKKKKGLILVFGRFRAGRTGADERSQKAMLICSSVRMTQYSGNHKMLFVCKASLIPVGSSNERASVRSEDVSKRREYAFLEDERVIEQDYNQFLKTQKIPFEFRPFRSQQAKE